MPTILSVIYSILPLVGLMLLFTGIRKKVVSYVISSLWISLIALIIHFNTAGGEILGSHFNYRNAFNHTINMAILCVSLIYIFSNLTRDNTSYKYIASFVQSCVVIGSFLLVINIWINAYFIENRMPGSPVMQVAMMGKPDYCGYKYIFYKIAEDGSVNYLCPNHYGLIPSVGHLNVIPDYIATQLSAPNKKKILQLKNKQS